MVFLQVFGQVIRNRAFFLAGLINISSSCLLHNIDITYKLTILTDREMKGSDPLAVQLCQLFHDLTIADIIHVHICNKDHSRKFIFLAEIPCLLCSNLNTGLTGNNDNRCICCTDGFLNFSHKIEISGCIQHIYFHLIPWYRNQRSCDGKMSLYFFLVIIADSIAILNTSESAGHTCQISHCLSQCCFACATMT